MSDGTNLTGVWNGLYTYQAGARTPESHFVAVILDMAGSLSGTIHETMNRARANPLTPTPI